MCQIPHKTPHFDANLTLLRVFTLNKPPMEQKINLYPQEAILIQKQNPKYVPTMCKQQEE